MGAHRDLASGLLAPSAATSPRYRSSYSPTTMMTTTGNAATYRRRRHAEATTLCHSHPSDVGEEEDDHDHRSQQTADHLISLSLSLLAKNPKAQVARKHTPAEDGQGVSNKSSVVDLFSTSSALRVLPASPPPTTTGTKSCQFLEGGRRARVWLTVEMSEKFGGGGGEGAMAVVREGVVVVDWVRNEGKVVSEDVNDYHEGQQQQQQEWTVGTWTVLTGVGFG